MDHSKPQVTVYQAVSTRKKHTNVGRSDVAVAIIAILWKSHVVFEGW